MSKLTAEQVKQLADAFMQMANALGDYRYTNIDTLTDTESLEIKELHNQLLEHTTQLYTKSAVLVMDDVESSLAEIDAITTETQTLFKKLTAVQNVLNRASSVLNLASAIVRLDPGAIISSLKNITNPAS